MRSCELCGVEFEPSKPSQRFCTSACRKRAHRQRKRDEHVGVVVELPTTEALLELSVTRAAVTQWRAAAFLLERKWPERWSTTRRAEPTLKSDVDDPFAEVDELAAKRRALLTPVRTQSLRSAALQEATRLAVR